MIVSPVRFEHGDPVLGIGVSRPRLSWQVTEAEPGWAQSGYELEYGDSRVPVDTAEQILVDWPFAPLESRERATIRVRLTDGRNWSDWSEPSTVEAGLLSLQDWRAVLISPRTLGGIGDRAPILYGSVHARERPTSARLYVTAHGCYTAWLGGERIGDAVLTPGWTSYPNRLRYQTYDVTALIRPGENRIEVLLGNGWYRGRLGSSKAYYGDRLALLAQLELRYPDGSLEVFGTDTDWNARESTVLADDLYDGQTTDLRAFPSTSDDVDALGTEPERLTAPQGPPVRVTETLATREVLHSPNGRPIYDFGQNLVGWVRIRLRGTRSGQRVTVRHAEVLEDGELGVRPLRSARATDSYLLDESAEVVLEPSLTFHGFRYAEIDGATPEQADVEAVVVGTDLRRTGWFHSSDAELDRFHENVVWGMRGNFLDVPTDCPQRDERLGWTGDIQAFAPAACFLYDTAGFLASWLADLAAEQRPDGSVPYVVPDVLGDAHPSAAAWGDAATVVPWVLYRRYGDTGILERQLDSMRAWVDRIASLTTEGIRAGGFQFGDWLDPDAPPHDPFAAKVDADVVATAYLARSADLLAAAHEVLGRDGAPYAGLAARTRTAFAEHFLDADARVHSDAPTGYALALEWDLLPSAEQRARAVERLVELVRANGFRINTGFVGTPLITDALTANGHPDIAYRLLFERSCPSWLYPVTMGATTVWERWDSLLPDGSINPGEMTSFNHYALGAIADWMHRTVAGLAPAEPGYRRMLVRPVPCARLTEAGARHETPYGAAAVSWRRDAGRFELEVRVPVGATASVHPPGGEPAVVGHGTHHWSVPDPCR
ncbi:family 78 glycoside hydrolase catalytic domain [Sciscionella marina]|uniref:family 78 glycoside hydrolase catalytic domain n=1 Tax=Sciscionella marina TaxID=508770 RepID=UPI00036333EC|nr:family 78 glycoside hydrolase catalytic domain [Sciscionella marina]